MFCNLKFIVTLVLLGICLASFNKVYGKPTSDKEYGVKIVGLLADQIEYQNENCRSGCDNGYCFQECRSAHSHTSHRVWTQCTSNDQCPQ